MSKDYGCASDCAHSVNIYTERQGWAAILPLDLGQLRSVLESMLNVLRDYGHFLPGIELQLVDDRHIAHINLKYLNNSGPTNILSFPGGGDMAGILILSLDTLERECMVYRQESVTHLVRLLAHGMGHLAGYEHGQEMEKLSMACQRAAMSSLEQFGKLLGAQE